MRLLTMDAPPTQQKTGPKLPRRNAAVVYNRPSVYLDGSDQAEAFRIEYDACIQAASTKNLSIFRHLCDPATPRPALDLAGFSIALGIFDAGLANTLIVFSTESISTDAVKFNEMMTHLQANGIRLVVVCCNLDTGMVDGEKIAFAMTGVKFRPAEWSPDGFGKRAA